MYAPIVPKTRTDSDGLVKQLSACTHVRLCLGKTERDLASCLACIALPNNAKTWTLESHLSASPVEAFARPIDPNTDPTPAPTTVPAPVLAPQSFVIQYQIYCQEQSRLSPPHPIDISFNLTHFNLTFDSALSSDSFLDRAAYLLSTSPGILRALIRHYREVLPLFQETSKPMGVVNVHEEELLFCAHSNSRMRVIRGFFGFNTPAPVRFPSPPTHILKLPHHVQRARLPWLQGDWHAQLLELLLRLAWMKAFLDENYLTMDSKAALHQLTVQASLRVDYHAEPMYFLLKCAFSDFRLSTRTLEHYNVEFRSWVADPKLDGIAALVIQELLRRAAEPFWRERFQRLCLDATSQGPANASSCARLGKELGLRVPFDPLQAEGFALVASEWRGPIDQPPRSHTGEDNSSTLLSPHEYGVTSDLVKLCVSLKTQVELLTSQCAWMKEYIFHLDREQSRIERACDQRAMHLETEQELALGAFVAGTYLPGSREVQAEGRSVKSEPKEES